MSGMKSKLISISRNNLLYLPTMLLNEEETSTKRHLLGTFLITVDEDTESVFTTSADRVGVLDGLNGESDQSIVLDQGLDTLEIPSSREIDSDLRETQFIVELDNRLGSIMDLDANRAAVSYIDDDNVASYYFTANSDDNFVEVLAPTTSAVESRDRVIRGPQGSRFNFKIGASLELQTSTFLFEKLGDSFNLTLNNGVSSFYFIDTIVRVTGATTGTKVEIPIRFIKLQ